jgi:uncharacterized protein
VNNYFSDNCFYMEYIAVISAFYTGLLGSFHCIGMCGAIALSLPIKDDSSKGKLWAAIVYNTGRVSTYGCIGLFFGFLGYSFSVAGFQQGLSISIGVIMLLFLFFPAILKYSARKDSFIAQFYLMQRNLMGEFLHKKSTTAFYCIGLLNGLLPCGLVYVALAGATATGGSLSGALYMIIFGLGTFPMMLLANQFRFFIPLSIRNNLRRLLPVFGSLIAFLFIMRGLNLGIPFLSPELQKEATSWIFPANCH